MDGHVSQAVLCVEYLYCRFIAEEYDVIYRGLCVELDSVGHFGILEFFFFFGGLNLEMWKTFWIG